MTLFENDSSSPSPEDRYIENELWRDRHLDLCEKLINLVFKQKDIFEAWYQKNIMSKTISHIAVFQNLSYYQAKKRVDTAKEIISEFHKSLHKVDD